MKTRIVLLALGITLCVPGCDIEVAGDDPGDTDGGAGHGGDPPSDGAIDECRQACDGLQFFDCIDGSTHETCWNACPDRPEGDVELFASCVSNSLPQCDPDCLEGLLVAAEPDPDPEPEPEPDTSNGGGGGNACVDACQAYVDAGCDVSEVSGEASCAQACGTLTPSEQDIVAACLDAPQTCELNPACLGGGEGGGVEETGGGGLDRCPGACDDLLFFDCITPAEHANCRQICESADADAAETFASCVDAVGQACDASCYAVFVG